jgi:hypothetical protein
MTDSDPRLLKRRIDIQREELAACVARFLVGGGQIVELPTFVASSAPPPPTDLKSHSKRTHQERENLSRQVATLHQTGVSAAQIALQLRLDRRAVARLIKAQVAV